MVSIGGGGGRIGDRLIVNKKLKINTIGFIAFGVVSEGFLNLKELLMGLGIEKNR